MKLEIEIEIAGARHLLTVDEARKLWVELRELFEGPGRLAPRRFRRHRVRSGPTGSPRSGRCRW